MTSNQTSQNKPLNYKYESSSSNYDGPIIYSTSIPEMVSERHKEAEADKAKAKAEQQAGKIISDQAEKNLVSYIGGQSSSWEEHSYNPWVDIETGVEQSLPSSSTYQVNHQQSPFTIFAPMYSRFISYTICRQADNSSRNFLSALVDSIFFVLPTRYWKRDLWRHWMSRIIIMLYHRKKTHDCSIPMSDPFF